MTADPTLSLKSAMDEAVALSMNHVHEGGIPFAAFVVADSGTVLGRGVNRVRELYDPTAHAEVQAIRDACQAHGTTRLVGATLLASGEPCAMCYMSALYAGISEVLFAADREEAARFGFDYRGSYALYAADPTEWTSMRVAKLSTELALQPFQLFQQRGLR